MNPINRPNATIELDLDVQLASKAQNIPSDEQITAWVMAALEGSNYAANAEHPTELTVRIVDTEESQNLNATYRKKDAPTNVLSFAFEAVPGVPLALLGDLVICAPVVEQEAKAQNKRPQAHWAHMVIHGTLHLLGYDHIETEDAELMEQLEAVILHSLGFPNPYATIN